jgi:hypothetical protein
MPKHKVGRRTEEFWATAPATLVRCTANLKSTGERCRREAILGATVCRMHGGTIPAVQAAAAARIGLTVETAVKELQRILTDPNADDRDKIAVARDLLDRGGLGATSKVLVGIASQDPVERLFQDILADPRMFAPPPALPAPKLYQAEGEDSPLLAVERHSSGFDGCDIVDAEIVEEPPARDAHTVYVGGSAETPRHIREALARLL